MSGFSCFPPAPDLRSCGRLIVDCAFPRFGPINRLSICNELFHHMQRSITPFFSFATGAQLSATDFFTRLRRIYNFAEVRFVKRVPCFLPFRSGKNRSEQFLPYTLPCIAVFAVPSPQSADVAKNNSAAAYAVVTVVRFTGRIPVAGRFVVAVLGGLSAPLYKHCERLAEK